MRMSAALNKMKHKALFLRLLLCGIVLVGSPRVFGDITYTLDNPQNWPTDIRNQIENSIAEAVALYNHHGSFNKHLNIQYNPGVPTADANWNGNIRFGGSRNTRVAIHEIAHTLGVGTYSNQYGGTYGTAKIREFDGPAAVLHGSGGIHFWPYGLNYDNEDGFIERIRHIRIVAALGCDWGFLGFFREPVPQTAALGGTAVLQVQAPNAQGYQWFKVGDPGPLTNGGRISGATSATLQIADVTINDEGSYYCRISRSGHTPLNSRPAGLTVERLVAQWSFDGSVHDVLGTYHATAVGSPQYVPGVFGQAIELNGSSDYVTLPSGIAQAAFTVAAWVNWDGGNAWQRLFDFGTGTSQYMFLTPRSGNNTLRFAIRSGVKQQSGDQVVETAQLPAGQWVHLAVTLSGNTATLYVDGLPVAANSNVTNRPFDFAATRNYIGRSQFGADPLFRGRVDDFRIYSYALSAPEIASVAFGSGLSPWGNQPHTIPGRIQAAHFDFGGPEIAYYDTTVGNAGGALRTYENVDIYAVTDDQEAYVIGAIEDGEWLIYTVNSTEAETDFFARVASIEDDGQIRLWLDEDLLATVDVPNTGSLDTWQNAVAPGLTLPDRENAALRLEFVGSGFRVNWIGFHRRTPYLGVPFELPGQINFEDFDIGGQQISYFDKSDINGYGLYRPDEPVDITIITGNTVIFAERDEWLEYTCNIEPGYYSLVIRNSVPYSPMQTALSIDGQTLAQFALPSTGAFTRWQETVIPNIYLPGGQEQRLRVSLLTSTSLLDSMVFVREYNVADISQSGRVDIDDFSILAAQWSGLPGDPSADIAPLPDGDGVVDILDLMLLAENWLYKD